MRDNIESVGDGGQHEKLLRLLSAMAEYDDTTDPITQERLAEEMRQLKKELVQSLEQFKNTECLVAGDKDADQAQFVVCATAGPGDFRVKGTVEVPCSKCGIKVLLSPDSPQAPPKVCYDCAIEYVKNNNEEEEQDSFGS